MTYEIEIVKLRAAGLTYKEISEKLGCSTGTVCYYIKPGQKEKIIEAKNKLNKSNPFFMKKMNFLKETKKSTKFHPNSKKSFREKLNDRIWQFSKKGKYEMYKKTNITVEDLMDKFGDNPKCYLTGRPIDINKTRTYEFDHIIPRSRGGDNSIDNLGLACKDANQAKRDMTPDEFINLCKAVLENNGYKVENIS